jgi:hypothetical protein
MESTIGISRALTAGEPVILSSGSTATVRKSYPAGYDGDVEILLDGAEEKELASNLTLVDEEPSDPGPELGDAAAAQREMGESRAPSREMKN